MTQYLYLAMTCHRMISCFVKVNDDISLFFHEEIEYLYILNRLTKICVNSQLTFYQIYKSINFCKSVYKKQIKKKQTNNKKPDVRHGASSSIKHDIPNQTAACVLNCYQFHNRCHYQITIKHGNFREPHPLVLLRFRPEPTCGLQSQHFCYTP